MANQPTKYKKFVATAATATLVASAIVPVASAASFNDVKEGDSHADAIQALVEQGIINGYASDNTFRPNLTLTRGQVVKMLGKWVEAQGFEVPADWSTNQRFADLSVDAADQELVKYAALVFDTEVFKGAVGNLNAGGDITRQNMALVLDRAYKAVLGQSLVEEAADLENVTVADLSDAREETRAAIQALANLEITNQSNFRPNDSVTRGQFASFLYRTINVSEATTPDAGEVAIASLKASKVNELTVEFNKAVTNTEAATFAVKQGTTTDVKVSDVDWNEAKTVATLTVDTKFVAATYNLTVTGVAEEALTASVTTTREVASEIKFNSNALVLSGVEKNVNGKPSQEARITYDVLNQYGQIITNTVATSNLEADVKGIDDNKVEFLAGRTGVLVVWVDEDEDEGTTGTIKLSFEQGDIELETTQEVTLSDEAEPGVATIVGVHSDAGNDFTSANVEKVFKGNRNPGFTDDFVVLFTLKDQFGAEISAEDITGTTSADTTLLKNIQDGLRLSVSNDDIFELDEDEITYKVVDGKYYFAAKMKFSFEGEYLEETGENTVTFRSTATGDEATSKITLESSSKVHAVSLSQPSNVVAGDEDAYVPVKVTDQAGNEIVDAALLNRLVNKGELTVDIDNRPNYTFVEKDGAVFLKFKTPSTNEELEIDIEIEVENTKEDSEITLDVQADAYANSLVKIDSGVATAIYSKNGTFGLELEQGDFVVEDQYGRVFDKIEGYTIVASPKGGNVVIDAGKNTIATSADTINLKAAGEGSNSIEFTLTSRYIDEDGDGQTATSKLSTTFRVVDEDDFVSYKIDSNELVYGKATSVDTTEVEVFGVLGNGQEVQLPTSAYQVIPGTYLERAANVTFVQVNEEGALELAEQAGANEVTTAVNVVISQTGETVSKVAKISDATSKVRSIKYEDNESASSQLLDTLELDITTGTVITSELLLKEIAGESVIKIKDQYDNSVSLDIPNGTATTKDGVLKNLVVTISEVSNEEASVRGNGTKGVQVTALEEGDSFTMTLTIDGVSRSIKVFTY